MPNQFLKQELQAKALALGFSDCRVAKAQPPPHSTSFLKWLEDGYSGEMQWLARNKERRICPELVLPGAQSILVLAMNYFQGPSPRTSEGRVARYAWGNDYHDLMLERLKELERIILAQGGLAKCYVDTGPVLERDHAAAAGIGWQGKSTMLLNAKLGTWFFLGTILTTLALPPDAPIANRCGSCTRCIEACPTGALKKPHTLDARLCISYLTIELKGSIPKPLRPLIGDRIYGCDECLEVCPWNRFAKESQQIAFAMPSEIRAVPLVDFLGLNEDAFRALFRNSPIKRIKRRGFLRNVCIALGNTGNPEAIPALEKAASDPEPLIAEHASWAIEQIKARAQTSASSPE